MSGPVSPTSEQPRSNHDLSPAPVADPDETPVMKVFGLTCTVTTSTGTSRPATTPGTSGSAWFQHPLRSSERTALAQSPAHSVTSRRRRQLSAKLKGK